MSLSSVPAVSLWGRFPGQEPSRRSLQSAHAQQLSTRAWCHGQSWHSHIPPLVGRCTSSPLACCQPGHAVRLIRTGRTRSHWVGSDRAGGEWGGGAWWHSPASRKAQPAAGSAGGADSRLSAVCTGSRPSSALSERVTAWYLLSRSRGGGSHYDEIMGRALSAVPSPASLWSNSFSGVKTYRSLCTGPPQLPQCSLPSNRNFLFYLPEVSRNSPQPPWLQSLAGLESPGENCGCQSLCPTSAFPAARSPSSANAHLNCRKMLKTLSSLTSRGLGDRGTWRGRLSPLRPARCPGQGSKSTSLISSSLPGTTWIYIT